MLASFLIPKLGFQYLTKSINQLHAYQSQQIHLGWTCFPVTEFVSQICFIRRELLPISMNMELSCESLSGNGADLENIRFFWMKTPI